MIEHPLRILCLNYEYPPVGGGGGRAAAQINSELVRRGHQVRVQTAGMRHLSAHEVVDGVEIFRAESFRKKEDTCTVPEMALYLATSLLPTLRHIRTWKPDVIHAHFAVPTGALAFKAHLLTGVPYVITAHLGDVPGGVPEQTTGLFRLVQPFTRPIWKKAAAVTTVSTFVADLAEKAYGRKPVVIHNGIPLGLSPKIVPGAPPRILMVGRLSLQKNPLLAIRALAKLHDIPWTCDIIGDGPLRDEIEREIKSGNLTGRIRLIGWLSGDAVDAEFAAADLLLMTSHNEGLPMAGIEALAHGLAIISTRIGGVADLIDNGVNGFLCGFDPNEIASRLRQILTDPTRLLAQRHASLEKAPEFDLAKIVTQYETVLQAAVAS